MSRGLRLTETQYLALSKPERPGPPPRQRKQKPPAPQERDIQRAILNLLQVHPLVGWARRFNTGQAVFGTSGNERYVRFAFRGCSDIIGQLRDGRFLAIEVKRHGHKPTPDQVAFLRRVDDNGGIAMVAYDVPDVVRELAELSAAG